MTFTKKLLELIAPSLLDNPVLTATILGGGLFKRCTPQVAGDTKVTMHRVDRSEFLSSFLCL